MHLWSNERYPFVNCAQILVLKYGYPWVDQQRDTVAFPQTLQIQSDHLKRTSRWANFDYWRPSSLSCVGQIVVPSHYRTILREVKKESDQSCKHEILYKCWARKIICKKTIMMYEVYYDPQEDSFHEHLITTTQEAFRWIREECSNRLGHFSNISKLSSCHVGIHAELITNWHSKSNVLRFKGQRDHALGDREVNQWMVL